ncbi:hypothetical protein LCGC14_1439970 [marine sediment metagenome]|uniref:Uncharacterized protein n=1 Tax=marine sediment metagenome TaxID=412755 RepID=A0A0F9M1K1_9ZZZZ|nr:hypothetical protein [Desulfobacterales bacterium]
MQVPLPRGAFSGQSLNVNANICENFFPEYDQEQGKSVIALYGTPGLDTALVTLLADNPVRNVYEFGGVLYAIAGSKLYSVTTGWVATERGIIGTASGWVDLDDDGVNLLICDGSLSYYYEPSGDTFAATPGLFTNDGSVTHQDGFAIYSEKDGQRMQIDNLLDPTTRDAGDITTVRRTSDNIVRVFSSRGELLVFKDKNIDIYYNTAAANFPFETSPGAFIDKGELARGALTEWDGVPYWIDDNRELTRMIGHETQKLNTPQIDYQFSLFSTVSDAILFSCEIQGHIWIVCIFPSESKTFVYDVSMSDLSGMHTWFTMTSKDTTSGLDKRHRSNCYAFFNNTHVIGDYETGKLFSWDKAIYSDAGTRIRRRLLFPTLHSKNQRERVIDHVFEIEFEAGVGLTTGQGSDPMAMVDYSNDGGHIFSNELWRSVGKKGDYKNLARWRRQGKYRQRNYRLTVTDPVKWVVVAANHDPERLDE